jgi:hypothetical protein
MLHLELDHERCVLDFPVEPESSFIEGVILADKPDFLYWSIHILTQDIPYCEEDRRELEIDEGELREGCQLQISELAIRVANWRDLANKRTEVLYEAGQVRQTLPVSESFFLFAGEYPIPNNNRIVFGERDGRNFRVVWSCFADYCTSDTGTRITVNTRLPLRRIGVYFGDQGEASIRRARELILGVAEESDLEAPDTSKRSWVYCPIRPEVA